MVSSTAEGRLVAQRYRLLRVLGRGGMGVVWQARDELLRRDVAVKEVLLAPELTDDERQVLCERTLREARAAARISHRNVVTVFDVVEEDGRPWVVMELVRSRSLERIIREKGPLSPGRAAWVGLEVLAALRVAHAAGVLHRDVKPSNVLIVPGDRVVLTDFGIAAATGDPSITAPGTILGSPAYVAPERARGLPASPKSDLWALGATLYTAVTGRAPHDRGAPMPTLMAVLNDDPDPPPRAAPLWPVLQGLLRRDPAERLDAAGAEVLLRRIAKPPERRPLVPRRPSVPGPSVPAGQPAAAAPPEPVEAADEPLTPATGQPLTPTADIPREPTAEIPREPTADIPRETAADEALTPTAPAAPARPGAWRRPRAAALLALLVVAAGGLLAWAALTGGGDRDRESPPAAARTPTAAASAGQSSGPQVQAPSGPAVSQAPVSPSGPSSPTQSGPAGAERAASVVPAGFHRYRDPSGFSLAVPNGWRRELRQGHVVYFLEPDGPRFMLIDQEVDPPQDMLADSQEQERNRRDGYRDYRRVRLERISYRWPNAADWEFTYAGRRQRLHVLIRSVLPTPHRAYGIYWSTPDAQWEQSLSYFRVFSDTFQPAPG